MSLLSDRRTRRTPWHLWLVGLLALLWNGFGAFDFVMTLSHNAQYMARFTQQQLDYFYSLSQWSMIAWGIGVWGGVLGAVFLLLRRGWSVWAFFLSMLAVLVSMTHKFFFAGDTQPASATSGIELWFSLAVLLVSVFLFFYAGLLNKNNRLR
ncbi:MAG: hypothetical protein ACK5ME_12490 [Parahaliea sp.]